MITCSTASIYNMTVEKSKPIVIQSSELQTLLQQGFLPRQTFLEIGSIFTVESQLKHCGSVLFSFVLLNLSNLKIWNGETKTLFHNIILDFRRVFWNWLWFCPLWQTKWMISYKVKTNVFLDWRKKSFNNTVFINHCDSFCHIV